MKINPYKKQQSLKKKSHFDRKWKMYSNVLLIVNGISSVKVDYMYSQEIKNCMS